MIERVPNLWMIELARVRGVAWRLAACSNVMRLRNSD